VQNWKVGLDELIYLYSSLFWREYSIFTALDNLIKCRTHLELVILAAVLMIEVTKSDCLVLSGSMNLAVDFRSWLSVIVQSLVLMRMHFECMIRHDFWKLPKVNCESQHYEIHAVLIISSSFLSFSDKVRPIPKANELSNIQTARTNKNEKVSYLWLFSSFILTSTEFNTGPQKGIYVTLLIERFSELFYESNRKPNQQFLFIVFVD
jgi:hypothetical protein